MNEKQLLHHILAAHVLMLIKLQKLNDAVKGTTRMASIEQEAQDVWKEITNLKSLVLPPLVGI
jgi:hypothetical protein